MGDRSDAARRANLTRKVAPVISALLDLGAFKSAEKDYAREQVARFLEPFGGPTADMHGPRGDSARLFASRGLEVISAENFQSEMFDDLRRDFGRDLLSTAAAYMADGWEFHPGSVEEVLPRCRTAFLDACGPLFVDSPSAHLVRAAVEARLDAFALTAQLSRVDGMRGGKDRSADYYLTLARTVLGVDAAPYRIKRVLRYESIVPYAVFMLEQWSCSMEGCDNRIHAVGLCSRHYYQQPARVAARREWRSANTDRLADYQREYYPNWKMNPAVRADWLEYHRDYSKPYRQRPGVRERLNEQRRARRADPEYRRRENEYEKARQKRKRAEARAAVSGTAAEAVSSTKAA